MTCVAVDAQGYVYAIDPQPALTTDCALVLVTGNSAASSPFALTPEQGAQIGVSILGLWALAFVFRMLVRALNVDSSQENHQ